MPNSYGRIEVITGMQRRRRWSPEEKAQIVAESYGPSTTVSAVARRYGINTNQLFLWRRLLRDGASTPAVSADEDGPFSFVPMVPEQPEMPGSVIAPVRGFGATIEVMAAGMTVRIPAGADEATVRCVLGVLRGLA